MDLLQAMDRLFAERCVSQPRNPGKSQKKSNVLGKKKKLEPSQRIISPPPVNTDGWEDLHMQTICKSVIISKHARDYFIEPETALEAGEKQTSNQSCYKIKGTTVGNTTV